MPAALALAPLALAGGYALLLKLGATRRIAYGLLEEGGPVELATFALLLAGGVLGLRLAMEARESGARALVSGFYAVFSGGLLLTALEEVAWGQRVLGFDTPAAFKALNRQGELTLHNLQGVHEALPCLPLLFGLGGLAGVGLGSRRPFHAVAAPRVLATWFLAIAVLAVLDVCAHAFALERHVEKAFRRLAELSELLVAASALLYVLLNRSRLRREWRERRGRRRRTAARFASGAAAV